MFFEKLKNYNVLLASGSKRRHELLNQLGVKFKIVNQDVEESFSNDLRCSEITDYLAKKKSSLLVEKLKKNDLLITSDTIVWHKNRSLGKPKNRDEALNILKKLNGKKHHLVSSVCISKNGKMIWNYTDKATLKMKNFSDQDLNQYLNKITDEALYAYNVYQIEGEGRNLFESIEGDENTIMGLPINEIKQYLPNI